MKNAKYTPGPWKVEVWDYSNAKVPRKELNIQTESNLLATLQCDFDENNSYVISKPEAEANARLMAAAPELLEALERLYAAFLDCDGREEGIAAGTARAAIAKAKGEAA